jgi:pyruvate-ferredoxin/flavodoxin oxidoreductase
VIRELKKGETVALNNPMDSDREETFTGQFKKKVINMMLIFIGIDASQIAAQLRLPGRLNVIQTVFFSLSGILPIEK